MTKVSQTRKAGVHETWIKKDDLITFENKYFRVFRDKWRGTPWTRVSFRAQGTQARSFSFSPFDARHKNDVRAIIKFIRRHAAIAPPIHGKPPSHTFAASSPRPLQLGKSFLLNRKKKRNGCKHITEEQGRKKKRKGNTVKCLYNKILVWQRFSYILVKFSFFAYMIVNALCYIKVTCTTKKTALLPTAG